MKDLVYEAQFEKINNRIKAINSPMLIVLIGLPGSGKSTLAKRIAEDNDDVVIVSSDAIRKEFYNDEGDQSHNDKVFNIVHKRLKENLLNNKKVILDATNISKRRRKHLISQFKNIPNIKFMAIAMAVTETLCSVRDANRDRVVGDRVIKRMLMNWCPPHYTEGFDFIEIFYEFTGGVNLYDPMFEIERLKKIPHDNPHHTLSIGGHMEKAGEIIAENFNGRCPFYLYAATLLHDVGKLRVKFYDEETGIAHYYNHQNYGAYLGLFYANYMGFNTEETLDFINIIYYHMEPLLSWKRSEKAHVRAIEELGSLYNDIMEVHKADVAAH